MRIVRREGGTVAPDGGPLTNAAYYRVRRWRQEWLALLPAPVIPTVIGPDGAVHGGPDGLRCLAGVADPLPVVPRATAGPWPTSPTTSADG
jgi:hypothetical protein